MRTDGKVGSPMTSWSVRDREVRRNHPTRRDTERTERSHIHLDVHPIFASLLMLPVLSLSSHLHLVVQVLINLRQLVRVTAAQSNITLRQATADTERRVTSDLEFEGAADPLRAYVYYAPPRRMLSTAGLSARWFRPRLWPDERLARTSRPLRSKPALEGDCADTDDGEI